VQPSGRGVDAGPPSAPSSVCAPEVSRFRGRPDVPPLSLRVNTTLGWVVRPGRRGHNPYSMGVVFAGFPGWVVGQAVVRPSRRGHNRYGPWRVRGAQVGEGGSSRIRGPALTLHTDVDFYDDPGWTPRLRLLMLLTFIPWPSRLRKSEPPLVLLRTSFEATLVRIAMIALVVPWVAAGQHPAKSWFWILVVGSGLYALLVIVWIRSRPLKTETDTSVASTYFAFSLIGQAVAAIPALVGFVCLFVMGRSWPFWLGVMFTLIDLVLVAPTQRDVFRRQEQIWAKGSRLSLGQALTARRAE
jgi:hypothetical protein